jgi:hypothetical protein
VEDDPEYGPVSLGDLTGPMAHRVPPVSAAAVYGPVPHGEDDPLPLGRPGDDGAGLRAWPLLDEDTFPSLELLTRLAQHDRHLEREDDVAAWCRLA